MTVVVLSIRVIDPKEGSRNVLRKILQLVNDHMIYEVERKSDDLIDIWFDDVTEPLDVDEDASSLNDLGTDLQWFTQQLGVDLEFTIRKE